jgi:hypothetical protein
MSKTDHWVNCKVAMGMTPGEYSVELKTADGKEISLFAQENVVDTKNGRLRVNVLENSSDSCLVYLPSVPFETSSRFINVPKQDVK